MKNETRAPLDAAVGIRAFQHSVELYQEGRGLDTLRSIRQALDGLNQLTGHAIALASQQGASAGDIGGALGITRQAARVRQLSAPSLIPDASHITPAEQIPATVVSVPVQRGHSRSHDYPIQVFRLSDGELVVIVQDVWENTSLMNASERIMAAVKADWGENARVLEKWLSQSGVGTPGHDGKYAWSTGTGGFIPADLDDLAARGLDLRSAEAPGSPESDE